MDSYHNVTIHYEKIIVKTAKRENWRSNTFTLGKKIIICALSR